MSAELQRRLILHMSVSLDGRDIVSGTAYADGCVMRVLRPDRGAPQ